jgi:hypothetical protein
MRATGFLTGTVALGLLLAGSLAAQQAAAPKDATGQCTDNSYTTAKTPARACLKHGGVKTWFGGSSSAPAVTAAETPAPAASASASAKTTADKSPPKDATGQCTDGSYTTAKTQVRACLKHGGVKTWSGGSESAPATPAAATSAPTPAASESAATTSAADKTQPKDATGQCTDGSYTTAKTQARGCLKHGGVKTWFGGAAASAAAPAAAATPAAAPPTPAPTVVKAGAAPARASAPGSTPVQAPANPTDVWVNLSTKAYHCPGTKWYGATKHGKYMSEADAKAAGFHPSYGKACS